MEIDFYAGMSIGNATKAMQAAADSSGHRVFAKFNGIELRAAPHGTTAEGLELYYHAESNRRHEEYLKSPECKEANKQAELRQEKREREFSEAIDGAPELALRDEPLWRQAVANNQDPYGSGVYRYAENWGRIMQKRIDAGATVAEAAKETQFIADKEGITGFMYGCAVSALAACWIHGEELRRWHNLESQIGTEGEAANESGGVLNPAVVSLG